MRYIELNEENFNILTEEYLLYCDDNQKIYEQISYELTENEEIGTPLNTIHLYKKVVSIGKKRLGLFRLYLPKTFRLFDEGRLDKDDTGLSDNEFEILYQMVEGAKDWYRKLGYLEKRIESARTIYPKGPAVKEHSGTLLATLGAASGTLESLADLLNYRDPN